MSRSNVGVRGPSAADRGPAVGTSAKMVRSTKRSRITGEVREGGAEVVGGLETVMGKLPGPEKRVPVDPKTEEDVDAGSYVRRLITYASEPGSRVPAYLCIPKDVLAGKRKAPAALCLHGTDNV